VPEQPPTVPRLSDRASSGGGTRRPASSRLACLLVGVVVLGGCGVPEPSPSRQLIPPSERPPSSPSPSPSPVASLFPVDCSWLPHDVCARILAAALNVLDSSDRPVGAWFGPPIEQHYPVMSPNFRGTVLFRLSSGVYRLVIVNFVAGEGIGVSRYEGSIPPGYPLPTPSGSEGRIEHSGSARAAARGRRQPHHRLVRS
jgi:hypothetical protein